VTRLTGRRAVAGNGLIARLFSDRGGRATAPEFSGCVNQKY
jgi:hypothetical protein